MPEKNKTLLNQFLIHHPSRGVGVVGEEEKNKVWERWG